MKGILGDLMVIWVVLGQHWPFLSPKLVFVGSKYVFERSRERHFTVKYAVEADFPDFAGGVSGADGGYFG